MARPDAFPADPALPALATAFDGEAMTALLARHLAARGAATVTGCAVETFRHRPGARTVVKYGLRVGGAREAHWPATGVLYGGPSGAARAEALAHDLRARAAGPAPWTAPFDPVAFVPELGMVLEVYPFDRRLPTLPLLSAGPPPAVAARLAGGAGADGPQRWTAELVRYRPELGAVMRWTLHAAGRQTRWYVKVGRDGDAASAPSTAWLTGVERVSGFVVRPAVLELPELNAVVLPEVPGTPLDDLLAGDGDVLAPVAAVARALAALHCGDARPERRFTAAEHVRALERAAGFVAWARPDLAARAQRIVGAVERAMDDGELVPTHRDLKPDHVLLDGGRPGLVDLDSCALADPILDPASLLARMYALPFERPVNRRRVDAAMRGFAGSYLPLVPSAWRRRLQPHFAGALLEVAASIFRRQVPGWHGAVGALVDEAERAHQALFRTAGPGCPTGGPVAQGAR